MARQLWRDLPPAVRYDVEQHTGLILKAVSASAGVNSGIATTLHTATEVYFAKGVPADHPQIRTQQREADINPHLPAACPRLLWHVQSGGWDLLIYDHLDGRHADYRPGSPDLSLVAQAIDELQQTPCPEKTGKRAEQRWASYLTPAEAGQLAGDSLLHTDLAPHNVLITDQAHLIDWAWPTRGAAWIDPAVLILRLMEAGHTAAEADAWCHRFPSWAGAPHAAVAAFAKANAHLWDEIARNAPVTWMKNMAHHADEWATYQHQNG
ncbi:aminoglycoside phosphotransferase [Streptomyces coryli]|nr:aminoglycoside phosphotransferase [Streptomyces coryli]